MALHGHNPTQRKAIKKKRAKKMVPKVAKISSHNRPKKKR